MARVDVVPWELLAPLSGRGHLIVAVLPRHKGNKSGAAAQDFGNVRAGQAQLVRLYDKLGVSGRVALSASRLHGRTEIRLAFENRADADRVAKAVGASEATLYGGWASERSFIFDGRNRALRDVEMARKPFRRRVPSPA